MTTDSPFPSERAEQPEFETLVANLCARPTMYVMESTVAAVVAYLSGYDAALGGAPLLGLHQWLIFRGHIGNNQHWTAIASAVEGVSGESSRGREEERIRALGALIEEFFAYRRKNGITKVFHEYAKWLLRKGWYRGPLRDAKAVRSAGPRARSRGSR